MEANVAYKLQKSRSLALRQELWGWLPAVSFSSATGLLVVAWADTVARQGNSLSMAGFWLALLLIFAPASFRLFSSQAMRFERIGILMAVGMSLYLIKVLHSPTAFTFHDEFLHWRTALDITQTQHLFTRNPLLPVSPLYPSLEIVTNAISSMSGLPVYDSGILLIGAARGVLLLSLFMFFEHISSSARIAGLAVLVYMANANFIFFDAQYSYESLALPLAVLVLYIAAKGVSANRNRVSYILMALLGIAAVTFTHHLTAYLLVLFLFAWAEITMIRHEDRWHKFFLVLLASVATVLSVFWTEQIGGATSGYLGPVFIAGFKELISTINGEAAGRVLFSASSGQIAPTWERIVGILSVLLILIGLPIGLYKIWSGLRQRPAAVVLALLVLIYPLSLVLRFTASGWEIANRTSEFVFIGISFVLTMAMLKFGPPRFSPPMRRLLIPGITLVILLGGVISGWPFWARLPGPYLVAADTRSIEPQGIAAANWARGALAHDQRMAADRINRLLMATYGQQLLVTHLNDNVDVASLYFAPQLGNSERQIIRDAGLRYLLVDYRLSRGLPELGIYFEAGEPDVGQSTHPLSWEALNKFDSLPGINRIFDSGDIVIYDVKYLLLV